MSNREDIAGGMSYRTMKGIDTRIMDYLAGHDAKSRAEIFEKDKEYYIASADKIMARFELAKIRIENMEISKKKGQVLDERLSYGLKWLNSLKNNIEMANDKAEFQKAVSYKKWHAIKLIPSAAEGYAIATIMERNLKEFNNIYEVTKLNEADFYNKKVKEIFLNLLNLKEDSDFKLAEKRRIEAYRELNNVSKLLDDIINDLKINGI